METEYCKSEVRVGHSLSEGEDQYVASRKPMVLNCLLKNHIKCNEKTAPTIAVLGSGGGLRAMVALLGSLGALGDEGLLDSVMYLSGVSGSTWCMSSLYKEPDWSTNMKTCTSNISDMLANGQVTWTEQLNKLAQYYETDNYSLTHVWAVYIAGSVKEGSEVPGDFSFHPYRYTPQNKAETVINIKGNPDHTEIDENFLTKQRRNHTKDPYPIYTVIDKDCKYEELNKDVWFEITPHESGYSLSGVFVNSSCLGCKFEDGALIRSQPEIDMLYLQGLCGSALAEFQEILKWLRHYFFSFTETTLDLSKILEGVTIDGHCWFLLKHLDLNLRALIADEHYTSVHIKEFKSELLSGGFNGAGVYDKSWILSETPVSKELLKTQTVQLCKEFLSHYSGITILAAVVKALALALGGWTWGTTYNSLYQMSVNDMSSSVPLTKTRRYEDAGLLLNSAYFSVLREKRNIDLIISLDFSAGDPFETVTKTAKLCKDLSMPFPEVHITGEPSNLLDFYVFKGYCKAPTVIHIPLFNTVNCPGPGSVEEWNKKYPTTTMHYTEQMISDLLPKAALNIRNNKDKLLQIIQSVVQEKKQNNI